MYHVEITLKTAPPHGGIEWEYDLSAEELEQHFLVPYRMAKPIVIRGRTIPMDELHRIRVYETGWRMGSITGDPPGRVRDRMPDVTRKFIIGSPGYEVEEIPTTTRQPHSTTSMKVFISHNSNDVEIATLFIELLRKALRLSSEEIRCTSVDGYRMQAGAPIDDRLRAEVHDAQLLIGLITPNSLGSAYVIFELGARWGAEKPMIPLLASGVTPEHLEGPLAGINALDSRDDGQVYQLLEDAAKYLQISLDKASSYAAEVSELVKLSSEPTAIEEQPPSNPASLQLSEDAKPLLIEATKSERGDIFRVGIMGGLVIEVNGKSFAETGNRRSEARWEQALQDLLDHGLVKDPKGKGEIFEVTDKGFQVADSLEASQ